MAGLVRNSTFLLVAQVIRTATQAVYFILVARALGPTSYGAFVAVAAFVGIVGPFASWGAGDLLVQHVARDPSRFGRAWGEALLRVAIVGTLCGVAVITVARVAIPSRIPLVLVLLLAAAEFWGSSIVAVGAQAYQAVEKLGRMGQVWVLLSVSRVIAAICLVAVGGVPGAVEWGVLYLVSTGATSVIVVWLVSWELGAPAFSRAAWVGGDFRRGFHYSVSLAAMSVYNDIDKTLLARLASLGSAGLYGAAYRAVEMAFTPVSALLYSSYPRFFQHGARGLKACLQLSKSLMPVALAYTVAVGIILYFTAPLLGLVLGHEYHDGIPIMRGLAALPFLRAIQYFGANSLTGADRQGSRSLAQVAIALVNVGLNLAFIPTYGWRAAVWTTLLSEGLLAVVLWGIAGWYVAMERPAPPREADEAKGEVEGIGLLRGRA